MDTLTLLYIFLATLAVLNLLGIFVGFFLYFRVSKMLGITKGSIRAEEGIKEGINEYVEKLATQWLSQLLSGYKDSLEREASEHTREFKQAISAQIKSLSTHTLEQEDLITREIRGILEKSLSGAQGEIDEYKKAQMEKIDEQVAQIVEDVSKEVLNRAIRIEEHEDLVWDALERAKGEGIFAAVGKSVDKGEVNNE
ncbi:MAG: hypothetical protein NUV69_05855 [Candidatus Curtissbacteria bacterium]|nr:hypothetical protein [Candidatus Curtissbacteria bacterium]